MQIDILKNILKDLSKIEFALRSENVSPDVVQALGVAIIELYRYQSENIDVSDQDNASFLSNIYFIINNMETDKYDDPCAVKNDILFKLSGLIEGVEQQHV